MKSTLCKDSHDTVNLERQATVEDQDVIDVAKALTKDVGEAFSSKLWLVTQVVSANREYMDIIYKRYFGSKCTYQAQGVPKKTLLSELNSFSLR